jgi:hypothetical protein
MSPSAELKTLQMVYGFKYHKRDPFISVPSAAGFYAYLASLLINPETRQDVINSSDSFILSLDNAQRT